MNLTSNTNTYTFITFFLSCKNKSICHCGMSVWELCFSSKFKDFFFYKKKPPKYPKSKSWCLWMDKLNNDNFQNDTACIDWYAFLFHCPFYNRSDAYTMYIKISAKYLQWYLSTFKMQISLDELLRFYCPNTKIKHEN